MSRHQGACERGTIEKAVEIIGLPLRTVQGMAARGEIPGAAKFGRRWTFDLKKLRRLVMTKERETWARGNRKLHPDAIGGAMLSTGELKSTAGTTDGRYTRIIQQLRANAKRRVGTDY